MSDRDPLVRGRRDYDEPPAPPPPKHPAAALAGKLWGIPLVKEVLVAFGSVWVAMGGTFQTPAAVLIKHIAAESNQNARQDSALSDLRISLQTEVVARRVADSVLLSRQLESRFYLRMLALDRCIARKATGSVPSALEPYCDRLQRGEDLPDPLRP